MLKDNMLDNRGLIFQKIEKGKQVEVNLLESMGQLLEYADYTGNEKLKEETLELIFKYFETGEGYLSWQIYKGKPQKATALFDELRILKVLLEDEKSKKNEFYIKTLKDSLYNFSLRDGKWVDFYDARCADKADIISLFYIDIETLKELAKNDKRFYNASKKAEEILSNAPVNDYGFFPQVYNYEEQAYIYSSSANMVENILTNMHYLHNGGDIDKFLSFLKREIDKGHIYNIYDYDGNPVKKEESTAVYALSCQLFLEVGDYNYADLCYKKMMSFRIKKGKLTGGFGDSLANTVYAYDQLEALKTMRIREVNI
ncbi:hypothetical protein [Thermosyntropha sp.]|uniref:hypothetical protein n=1 Tax=Thermosyntropha sp. TaxID=2740820 RepID=UPI0025D805CC|nr:hypothetical protein [Thermosyntropha sp.]MBO8159573.1 hypothetical protein [Thermosyntropha sp.]